MKIRMLLMSAVLVVSGLSLQANSPSATKLVQLKEMCDKLHSEWIDFSVSMQTKKMKIIKEQKHEWMKFGIEFVKNVDAMKDGDKESFFARELQQAIALKEKHIQQWKQFGVDHEKEMKHLIKKDDDEFKKFKQGLPKHEKSKMPAAAMKAEPMEEIEEVEVLE